MMLSWDYSSHWRKQETTYTWIVIAQPLTYLDRKLISLEACSTAHTDRVDMPVEWKMMAKSKEQTGEKRKGLKKGEVRTKNLVNVLQW